MTTRRGSWMLTYTGRQFWPMDPDPDDVDPTDIAHALAHLCRYNGHVARFYSVAEHCLLLSHAVAPRNALWALLHDATEAYVGDMIRPLKWHIPDFSRVEDGVMDSIAQRFGLAGPMPAEVKAADSRILLDERAALLTLSAHPWAVEDLEPLGVAVQGLEPPQAKASYLARLHELVGWVQ